MHLQVKGGLRSPRRAWPDRVLIRWWPSLALTSLALPDPPSPPCSRKGQELDGSEHAAFSVYWEKLQRQVSAGRQGPLPHCT